MPSSSRTRFRDISRTPSRDRPPDRAERPLGDPEPLQDGGGRFSPERRLQLIAQLARLVTPSGSARARPGDAARSRRAGFPAERRSRPSPARSLLGLRMTRVLRGGDDAHATPGMTTRSRESTVFSATTCRLPFCSPRGTGTSITRPGRESAESPSSASPNRALAIPMSSRASSRHGTRTDGVTRSPIPAHSSRTLGAVSRNTPMAKSRGRDLKPVTALSTSTAKEIARGWVHSSRNPREPARARLERERVVAPRRDSGEVLVRFEIEREPRSLQEPQVLFLRREPPASPSWSPARAT